MKHIKSLITKFDEASQAEALNNSAYPGNRAETTEKYTEARNNLEKAIAELVIDLTGVTRADLASFGDCRHDSKGNPCVWLNKYHCSECDFEYDNRHSCQCDDRCPNCNASISPHTSNWCAAVPEALIELWEQLPEAT